VVLLLFTYICVPVAVPVAEELFERAFEESKNLKKEE